MKITFKMKALFFMIPILIVVSLIYTYESIKTEKEIIKSEIIKRAGTITTLATKTGELPVLSGNPEVMKEVVSFLNANSEVTSVTFYDNAMVMLIHDGPPLSKPAPVLSPELPIAMYEDEDAFVFYAPIFTVRTKEDPNFLVTGKARKVRENIGWVRLGFSKAYMTETQRKIAEEGMLLALIFTVCSSVIVYFLINLATRPLLAFTRHVEELPQKTGKERFLPVSSHDEIGKLTKAFNGMVADLDSQRERIEESEAKFRNFAEQAIVGIYLFQDGTLKYVNPRFAEIYGYAADELLDNMPFEKLVFPEDLGVVTEQIRKRTSGEIPYSHYEVRGMKKDGSVMYLEIYGSATLYNKRTAIIGTLHDITERKQAEEELRKHREHLERVNWELQAEIAERKRTEDNLKKVYSELEMSNEELKQFTYSASHDLQEPLRMVSSFLQLLESKYKGRLDAQADQYIAFAVDGSKRMQKLIEDLLAYSQIIRKIEFSPVDTNRVFTQAVSNLSAAILESHAVITSDELPTVSGNETQLMQLFQNLIRNAIKFRKPGTHPSVHVFAREEGNEWLFSVRDNGIGIRSEYFGKIFQLFQRLHKREEYPGTGIGLTLCKKIVESHHGHIWLESVPGEGTTFFFTLPVIPPA